MSKSENQNATIYLADSDDAIRNKMKKAKTDLAPTLPNSEKPEAIANLFALMNLVSERSTVEKFEKDFAECTIQFGQMKTQLAEDIIKVVAPVREKAAALLADSETLKKIIREGAERSRESAARTITEVRKLAGLNYQQ
jgi:tryptophanyl-tRNA synthetase